MFAWKCWRETRTSFFIFLISEFAAGAVLVAAVLGHQYGFPEYGGNSTAARMATERDLLVIGFLAVCASAVFLAAIVLGSTAVGSELDAGTAEYLWTQPRARTHFHWTHWGVVVGELAALSFLPTIAGAVFVAFRTGSWNQWEFFVATPFFVFASLPALGLAVLTAALRRSRSGSLIFTTGILLGYGFILDVLKNYWDVHVPLVSSALLYWLPQYDAQGLHAFPWGAAIRVAALAVVFPVTAHYVLRRAEV